MGLAQLESQQVWLRRAYVAMFLAVLFYDEVPWAELTLRMMRMRIVAESPRRLAMQILFKLVLSAGVVLGLASSVLAQGAQAPNPATKATISDPEGPPPNPANVPFVLPKDIKWTGDPARSQTAVLYGDQSKEGPYGVLIKWAPGSFSRPHFHDQTRWIYVVSGTWWVSSSNVYDEKTTYPFHAGTFSTDVANTVHWDGARSGEKEPAIILLTGVGPVKTVQVDEHGKPLPPRGRGNE